MIVQPHIHLNPLALLAAVVASMAIGFLWFGPLFGRAWAKEMNFPPDFKPSSASMIKATLLQLVGTVLTVYVLAHTEEIWRPSTWNLGEDGGNAMYGCMSAFFTWLGFYIPQLLGSVAWENKSWKLLGINASGTFFILLSQALIIAIWR